LVLKYQKTKILTEKKGFYDFYLTNRSRVNNWDLVDGTAPYIVGNYHYNLIQKMKSSSTSSVENSK